MLTALGIYYLGEINTKESISKFNELSAEFVNPPARNEHKIDITVDINLLQELDEIERLEFNHSLSKEV